MKKTVKVITEQEFEIDIPDYQLTPEHIALFESGIFSLGVEGDDHESKVNVYFKYAAEMAARDYTSSDGLGDIGPESGKGYAKDKDYYVTVEENYYDVETEIL